MDCAGRGYARSRSENRLPSRRTHLFHRLGPGCHYLRRRAPDGIRSPGTCPPAHPPGPGSSSGHQRHSPGRAGGTGTRRCRSGSIPDLPAGGFAGHIPEAVRSRRNTKGFWRDLRRGFHRDACLRSLPCLFSQLHRSGGCAQDGFRLRCVILPDHPARSWRQSHGSMGPVGPLRRYGHGIRRSCSGGVGQDRDACLYRHPPLALRTPGSGWPA